jgi:hypothetical protein
MHLTSNSCVAGLLRMLVLPPGTDKPQEGSHTTVYAALFRRPALYPPLAGLPLNVIYYF